MELIELMGLSVNRTSFALNSQTRFWLKLWLLLARCPEVPKGLFNSLQNLFVEYHHECISNGAPSLLLTPKPLKELVRDMESILNLNGSKPKVCWSGLPSGIPSDNMVGIVLYEFNFKSYLLLSDVQLVQTERLVFKNDPHREFT